MVEAPRHGSNSVAIGAFATASGKASTAIGSYTIASGSGSSALGVQTTARSFAEISLGAYNTDYTPASTVLWNPMDRLFVIGNGTYDSWSDALVL
ncbi:MAG: hypothetical protein IPJ06_12380 [Saprospiraceae bacterium]|nr:hypothetical protein [Saprospiraceae bacterium]